LSDSIPTASREAVKSRDTGRCVRCWGVGSEWHHRRSRSVRDEHRHCPCGSTGQAKVPRGGAQSVVARHTIGAYPCWCQGELCWVDLATGDQVWPGKEKGKPHPRQGTAELLREVLEMTKAAVMDDVRIERNDIRAYPKKVQDLVMVLVNECHIRYRLISGMEMFLYPPDGVSRPFKIRARRSEKETIRYLHSQFIDEYSVEMPKKKEAPVEVHEPVKHEVVEKKVPTVTFSGSVTDPKPEPVESLNPRPTALPSHPEGKPDTKSVWTLLLHTKTEEPMENWETDGKVFRCVPCRKEGKEVTFTQRLQLGGHTKAAHQGFSDEDRRKQGEALHMNTKMRKVERAFLELQAALGLEPPKVDTTALEQQVEFLKKRVAVLTEERDAEKKRADDNAARIELLKEALGA
jgi:hypothetical protein